MDTLETFQTELQRMIDKYSLNVNISEVTEMVTERKQHIFSASLIVSGLAPIPTPSEEGVSCVKTQFLRFICEGFRLKTLQYMSARVKDMRLLRWQVQYLVESVELQA